MNKVYGKTIFTQNGPSIQKLWQETCFFAKIKQLFSQSMQSTFEKLFAHVLLVV
jgi:hypothetical protein